MTQLSSRRWKSHPEMFVRAILLLVLAAMSAAAAPLQLWFYASTNLQVDANATELIKLMERASAAGYSHFVLADSKLARLDLLGDNLPKYTRNAEKIKAAAARLHLEIVPAVFPVGYSNALLAHDPNLVEGPPVKALPMVVHAGVAEVADQAPTLPDFSDLKRWNFKDSTVTSEEGSAHSRPDGKNSRIAIHLKVQPWQQYHLRVALKTKGVAGELPEVKAIAAGGLILNRAALGAAATQEWKEHDVVFNSLAAQEIDLYFGTWGAKSGEVWWRAPKLEKVAFVNLIRRDGCPLLLTTAEGKPLQEGKDFEPLHDPLLGTKPWPGEYDVYHRPPVVRTHLPEGTHILASYFHATTLGDGQAMVCPSEPQTLVLLRREAELVHRLWKAKGYLMSHDECRVMNWCDACQHRGLSPGELLAENVRTCAGLLREINPGGQIYVWSDMFDPNHNAVPGPYYLVNGPLTDSWKGLDPDVIVLPWYFEKRNESLKFFAARGNKQVIAAYYDSRPTQASDWLRSAASMKDSVIGIMYTTWRHRYTDLEPFARVVGEAAPR